ncbi:GNAT family N-acetyltransferase [Paraferrimonas sedimenticola]|nr:GNAT family N-acetyltransferase [Paraferrimonas sedimenticola]
MKQLLLQSVATVRIPQSLLLEADPDVAKVEAYRSRCLGFAAMNEHDFVGACLVEPQGQQAELLNIAVTPELQGQGVGAQLLKYVINDCRHSGFSRLYLGTGTFGHQLGFYQRAGFRVIDIEKDYFLEQYAQPIWENGIQHKDRLILSINLAEE